MVKETAKNGKAKNAEADTAMNALSFEQALTELEQIVNRLERGDVPLAQSIAIYERGESLKKHCEHLLQGAEVKVEKIRFDEAGAPQGAESLD